MRYKKKELVGNFKNSGSEWRESGDPREVNDHDFPEKDENGVEIKLIPYGILDLQRHNGFVVCNTSHDTPELVFNALKRWWETVGIFAYPHSKRILLLADAGGSNGIRPRMFKKYMQDLANLTGREIHVSHYPRGTSKWNPIERQMFAEISKSTQAKPLVSVDYAVNLIGATTTTTGLTVTCQRDNNQYQLGQKLSNRDFAALDIRRKETVSYLNYWFKPNSDRKIPGAQKVGALNVSK